MSQMLWNPSDERKNSALITDFMNKLPIDFESYFDLHKWSVANLETFWSEFWEYSGIIYSKKYDSVLSNPVMPGAKWFLGSELNYAQNLLSGNPDQVAIISTGENRQDQNFTFKDLNVAVSKAQMGLENLGVQKGSRVAAFVPNCVESIVLMLATSACGAIWTSCSPDFGSQGAIDRFGQVEPSILIVSNGYSYNGKIFPLDEKINGVINNIDSIQNIICIDFVDVNCTLNHESVISYNELLLNNSLTPNFVQVPFDHPLYIMYSSGTTGPPKSIVHGVGGTLIQHLKEHQLQCDIQAGKDRLFWFTTCGWMMWNWLVSALASGATIVLYDGSPSYPTLGHLWDMAERTKITHFGTSPKFLSACSNIGLVPKDISDLSNLKSVLSTGAPLVPEQYDWVYDNIKSDIQLSSISGGTDIIGCFLAGSPILPVYRGEIQCVQLGMDVQSWNDAGESIIGESGELVCVKPFPSMPVKFWNDNNDKKYHSAYFEDFDNVWTHGDYVKITESGGAIISGRSDTTLNPGGVRIGTAEIYRSVENIPEISDAIVVGRPNADDVEIVLFIKLNEGIRLDSKLSDQIKTLIRLKNTPRHVPKYIFEVRDIPYTISGKKVEKAILSAILGEKIKNKDALANPESLKEYSNLQF
ncbi:MAG: acetoacetate--CoA ligase [Methanobacteriota archaeon]|jgi:acetoacetyl-CoA synthetase|nr:MAG: acetoacetate--CoA ligase [Euryarchaeota archaeon]